MNETVLVTGATGTTGSALVELLLEHDVAVRAMVRSDAAAARFAGTAVTPVVADLDDPAAVASALAGVDRAYLVTPSSERAQVQQERFAELAAEAGVAHLVKLSQLAADEGSPVRFLRYHAAVERRIRELGIAATFLRPNLFLQGMLAMAGPIREGRLFAPIGDARVSAVDVRDIAAVAAAVLTGTGHEGATYTITGPAAYTHAEIAAVLGEATGRPVTFVDVPPAAFAEQLRGVLPDWQVEGLLEDYAHYARGEAAAVLPTVRDVTGREPRTAAEFARDHKAAFTPG
ncbi:SDR family oxidoreductase [Pseudonocardia sp. MH-G8]|uniref:SDR family oxidoreductase n=1 Tax=Pseudonocardia sp. MH-G8 TaxID=1854588 RepID=UPI000BA06D36|nr:SDR family oxidoreductase [Pseudonocardia sp. MH-G8]OZM83352.1 NAD(P)-dependent oxidoreductase [Pseudonocardia sp. MH-G8]